MTHQMTHTTRRDDVTVIDQTSTEFDDADRVGLDHRLAHLEAHAIFVIREVAAECERPVLLFSGGKDSVSCCTSPGRRSSPVSSRSQ